MIEYNSSRSVIQPTIAFANKASRSLPKKEHKEAIQEKDAIEKKCAAAQHKNMSRLTLTLNTNDHIKKTFVAGVKLMDMT